MLKKKFLMTIKLGLGVCLFPLAASAHLISITATQAFPTTVATSSTTNAVYQVTNLTSHVTLTIVDKSSFPNGLSISSSTCGNPIGPGQSCSITLKLVAPSTAQTISTFLKEWAKPSADGVQVPINVTVTGGSTPVTIPPVAVAVGIDDFNALGLIVASTDGGTTWRVKNFTFNADEALGFVNCVQGTTKNLCMAAGPASQITPASTLLLPISTDGGNTWSLADTSAVNTNSIQVFGASCTGTGSNLFCIIVGGEFVGNTPYLIQSSETINRWQQISITSDTGVFNGASCTGSGSTAICIASGEDTTTSTPLLAVTNDGGTSWSTPSITGFASGNLGPVSCTGSGSTAVCAVITGYNTSSASVASSTDGGTTWNAKTISLVGPTSPSLIGISCTGSGSTALCIGVGYNIPVATHAPLLVKSSDGGNTWSNDSPALVAVGQWNSVSCTGSGSTATCVAVGENSSTNDAIIATTNNGASSWTVITNPVFPGQLKTVSCTGNYCLAAGVDNSGVPLIIQSFDSGQTWSQASITGNTLAGRLFGSAAVNATTLSSSLSSSSWSNALTSKIIKPEDQLKKFIK